MASFAGLALGFALGLAPLGAVLGWGTPSVALRHLPLRRGRIPIRRSTLCLPLGWGEGGRMVVGGGRRCQVLSRIIR